MGTNLYKNIKPESSSDTCWLKETRDGLQKSQGARSGSKWSNAGHTSVSCSLQKRLLIDVGCRWFI